MQTQSDLDAKIAEVKSVVEALPQASAAAPAPDFQSEVDALEALKQELIAKSTPPAAPAVEPAPPVA